MVSNVFFYSGKHINLRRAVSFAVALLFVALLLVVVGYPPGVLFGLFVCYSLSGYVLWVWRLFARRKPVVNSVAANKGEKND
jgi:CDP-diacylglycerol--serine O-phosphatidyltransferase